MSSRRASSGDNVTGCPVRRETGLRDPVCLIKRWAARTILLPVSFFRLRRLVCNDGNRSGMRPAGVWVYYWLSGSRSILIFLYDRYSFVVCCFQADNRVDWAKHLWTGYHCVDSHYLQSAKASVLFFGSRQNNTEG